MWGYVYVLEIKVSQVAFEADMKLCECLEEPRLTKPELIEFYQEYIKNSWTEVKADSISFNNYDNIEIHIFTLEDPIIFTQGMLNPSGATITKDFHNIKIEGELIAIYGV